MTWPMCHWGLQAAEKEIDGALKIGGETQQSQDLYHIQRHGEPESQYSGHGTRNPVMFKRAYCLWDKRRAPNGCCLKMNGCLRVDHSLTTTQSVQWAYLTSAHRLH